MGRVRRDSLATAEETIDGKAVSIDSKDSLSKFKDSTFVNSSFCTKCKKEESEYWFSKFFLLSSLPARSKVVFLQRIDGRWIQCDKCLKWYHTACVRIQLDNNGKFSGDYYCRECRRLAKQAKRETSPNERDCKTSRRLSVSSAGSSRSSEGSHKKLKTSNGSASRMTPPLSESSTSSGDHNGVGAMEIEVDQAAPNRHDNFDNSNVNESQKKQTCKLQKNGPPQKPNNIHYINDHPATIPNGHGLGHGGRKEKKPSFSTTTNDAAESPILFHPYNWPHPVSYNRALHRVAQIREFILTHCPAAASSLPLSSSVGDIGVNGIGINMMDGIVDKTTLPDSSIKIAIGLWYKLERLEKSHNKKHLSLSNHNINSQ
ncbi:17711_t:CDS:2 [Acaulospora morrowiae]|uniref:17711_t:CDS:1 n=1 Tax=Acaulospora morrowiae TaxID=94023 RepID=A0A9N9G5N0_9GLOM|nr:17711_t:CDS:2 [Acaulospora morrowiae]